MDWEQYKAVLMNNRNTYEMISEFAKQYMPNKLYKYGSLKSNYWENVIFNGETYFTMAKDFNDPFDCRPHFNMEKMLKSLKVRDKLGINSKLTKEEKIAVDYDSVREIFDGMQEEFKVFCFSEVWDSILMWSHYADSHSGYCVEYNVNTMSNLKKNILYPVIYSSNRTEITDDIINGSNNCGLISLVEKSDAWKYEKEWRLIKPANKIEKLYFREEIKSIILGNRCSKKDLEKVCAWAKENKKNVYQIELDPKEYKLVKNKII